MAFDLPPDLLRQLRERRAKERSRLRQSIGELASRVTADPPSWLTRMKRRFRLDRPDLTAVAEQFVLGMHVLQIEMEDAHDAFLLDPGMGPMTYLTPDGRVLADERSFFGDAVHEVSDDDAIASIVVGAKKTGLADLLSLVPRPPPESSACPKCEGKRWADLAPGYGVSMVCLLCSGRGWVVPSMIEAGRSRGVVW